MVRIIVCNGKSQWSPQSSFWGFWSERWHWRNSRAGREWGASQMKKHGAQLRNYKQRFRQVSRKKLRYGRGRGGGAEYAHLWRSLKMKQVANNLQSRRARWCELQGFSRGPCHSLQCSTVTQQHRGSIIKHNVTKEKRRWKTLKTLSLLSNALMPEVPPQHAAHHVQCWLPCCGQERALSPCACWEQHLGGWLRLDWLKQHILNSSSLWN